MKSTSTQPKPLIVFIHGLAASRFMFLYLQWHLRRRGFRTKLFGYRSVWKTIPLHADRFSQLLKELESDPNVDQFHIVAHSMGGIVARQAILQHRPRKLKRLLMLATPNQGSAAARKLSRIFRFSKTLAQISDAEGSYVRQLGFPDEVDCGVIHASVDRVVTRDSCLAKRDLPIREINSGHNDLLFRPSTAAAVDQFLRTGDFSRLGDDFSTAAKLGHS